MQQHVVLLHLHCKTKALAAANNTFSTESSPANAPVTKKHATIKRFLRHGRLKMVFDEWVAAIRSLLDSAPEEAASCFSVEDDHSFLIDAVLFEARKAA